MQGNQNLLFAVELSNQIEEFAYYILLPLLNAFEKPFQIANSSNPLPVCRLGFKFYFYRIIA